MAAGINSYCVVPLMVGGKSIGTLNFASVKINQYSEADADFLCELGSQVALAVSNMTSYQEIAALSSKVERTAERYRTLLEINNVLVTNLNQQALLHAISKVSRSAWAIFSATLRKCWRPRRAMRVSSGWV